jgi:hypothetical protein
MQYNGKKLVVKKDASTEDIIEALIKAGPIAVHQVKNHINSLGLFLTGDALKDALKISDYIRSNVKYEADGYTNQNIQLPARMFKDTKKADCKSFSLAFFSLMKAAGHDKVGFRFASYKKNKIPTHVYNWFVDRNNNFYTFDTCVKTLKESKKFTFIKDMQVNYLTGPYSYLNGKEEREARREKRKERREKRREEGKGVFQGVKKVALALPRNAFRGLVALNVRGLATSLNTAIQKNPSKVKGFWEKLGGKYEGKNSLVGAINDGKNKKPVFGERGVNGYYDEFNEAYIGSAAAAAIAAATPILLAAKKLLAEVGIKPEDLVGIITPGEEKEATDSGNRFTDGNFEASDDENKGKSSTTGFMPSPLLIGGVFGAGVLIYMLTKKKK